MSSLSDVCEVLSCITLLYNKHNHEFIWNMSRTHPFDVTSKPELCVPVMSRPRVRQAWKVSPGFSEYWNEWVNCCTGKFLLWFDFTFNCVKPCKKKASVCVWSTPCDGTKNKTGLRLPPGTAVFWGHAQRGNARFLPFSTPTLYSKGPWQMHLLLCTYCSSYTL